MPVADAELDGEIVLAKGEERSGPSEEWTSERDDRGGEDCEDREGETSEGSLGWVL